jgi:anti-anti-sigma factor
MLTLFTEQIELVLGNERFFREFTDRYLETVRALSRAYDARSTYTAGHSERVARLGVAIARQLGLPQTALDAVREAGLLHDAGMCAVVEISDSFQADFDHPTIGASMIEMLPIPPEIADGVRTHHEWYNGWGFPGGLKGAEIPQTGQILAVAEYVVEAAGGRPGARPAQPRAGGAGSAIPPRRPVRPGGGGRLPGSASRRRRMTSSGEGGMEYTVGGDAHVAVVAPAGEIDVAVAPRLQAVLKGLLDEGRTRVVIDMSGITFIDSAGLGILVNAYKLARARGATSSSPPPCPRCGGSSRSRGPTSTSSSTTGSTPRARPSMAPNGARRSLGAAGRPLLAAALLAGAARAGGAQPPAALDTLRARVTRAPDDLPRARRWRRRS